MFKVTLKWGRGLGSWYFPPPDTKSSSSCAFSASEDLEKALDKASASGQRRILDRMRPSWSPKGP